MCRHRCNIVQCTEPAGHFPAGSTHYHVICECGEFVSGARTGAAALNTAAWHRNDTIMRANGIDPDKHPSDCCCGDVGCPVSTDPCAKALATKAHA